MRASLVATLTIAVACGRATDRGRRDLSDTIGTSSKGLRVQLASSPAPNGLYFGTSEGPDGVRAWLLRIDGSGRTIRLYAPPDNPVLASSDSAPESSAFRVQSTPGFANNYYVLTGHVTTEAIETTIETVRAGRRGATVLSRDSVRFRLVQSAAGQKGQTGLYSNVGMNSESGDASGEELVLLEVAPGRRAAVLTTFGGDLVPYAATELSGSDGQLRARFRTSNGLETYELTSTAHGVQLRALEGDASAPETLSRKAELAEFLRIPHRP